MLSTWIRTLKLPLEQNRERGWKPHWMFRGPTPNVADLSCHVSVLSPGITPHPPHEHAEEELLVILDGEAELILLDRERFKRTHPVRPGFAAYYPAYQVHTLRGAGNGAVT